MDRRLFTIFILGFSSGLPLSLISSTLQAWFASCGLPVMTTGALSLVSIPYAYRMLWGPVLDRVSLFGLGRRRGWIFAMQICLLLGFNVMAFFSPSEHASYIALLALLMAVCSATQDMAIDAQRVEYLPEHKHALGASITTLGYRLALLFSGGLALVIARYLGFSLTYRFVSLFLLAGMMAVWFSKEPYPVVIEKANYRTLFVRPFKELMQRKGIIPLLLFIFCFKLGEAFTTTTSGIVMPFLIQGIGFSPDTIGYVNQILGVSSILAGGLLAGILLMRYSLFYTLLFFGLLQACTNVLFVVLAMVGKNTLLLSISVFADNFAAGMGSTALVALFMRLVDKRFTGTQFSILVAISTIPRIASGPIAASLQMWLGWVGMYQCAALLALLFVPFLVLIKQQVEARHQDIGEDAAALKLTV